MECMKYIVFIKVVLVLVVIIIICFCIFGELLVYVIVCLYVFGYMIGGLFSIYIMRRKMKMNMKVVIYKVLFW